MEKLVFADFNQAIDFESLNKDIIEKKTKEIIEDSDNSLKEIFQVDRSKRTYKNTIQAFDDIYNKLFIADSVITLLAYTHPEDELRQTCLEKAAELSKYFNSISLNVDLYNAFKDFSETEDAKTISPAAKKYLQDSLDAFKRNGLAFPEEKRKRVKELKDKISDLSLKFEANINEYDDFILIDEKGIDGLPEDYKKAHLQDDGKYKVDLSYPSYVPFMKYAHSDDARKELHFKFLNRAADTNLDVLKEVLEERKKLADILGYETYAQYGMESKMAKNPKTVWGFENELNSKVRVKAEKDMQELLDVKSKSLGIDGAYKIKSWEAAYYKNIQLKENYQLDNEKLKEYFPVDKVIEGLFSISEQLYGVKFVKKDGKVWHKDVWYFEVIEKDELIARFYLDLFPRKNKFSHAACFSMIPGKNTDQGFQLPNATLVCNFPKPTEDKPALMPHNDVVTFFHEFGHLMHSLLTKTELAAQAGTNTTRDFVEMPSQIFEKWAWNYDALQLFAKHYKTDEVLPRDLFDKLYATQNVGSGLAYLQQIFYGMVDLTYHDKYDPAGEKNTTQIVEELQNSVTLYEYVKDTHFEAGFGHLMGYAAGYYSYLWAKVFSEDMFSVFEEKGILNKEAGQKLKEIVLEKGGSVDEMEMVKSFLGREPKQDAFLKSIGL